MIRISQLPVAMTLLAALAAACGGPPPLPEAVEPGSPDDRLPIEPDCTSRVVSVAPLAGDVPVARTSPVTLQLDGPINRAKIVVVGEDGEIPGRMLVGERTVVFVPDRPYPAGRVSWEANVCETHVAGSFSAGALLHPVDVDQVADAYAGKTFAVDLRYGDWLAPLADDGLELVLRSMFGGALLVKVEGAAPDRMTIGFAAARVDEHGAIVADPQGSRGVVTAGLKDNPYVPFPLGALTLDVDGRALRLSGATLVLGLHQDGIADARLSAEVDVRDFGELGGRDGCDLLASASDAACAPCSADGNPSCFQLQLSGLQGVQSSPGAF